jgi:hypothetical protein
VALTRTLAQLREAVQRTADIREFTEKHPDAYVNDLINRGLGALSRICRTTNPEFQPIGSTTITTDGIESSYALPSNFRSLISVVYTDENSVRNWLQPYEFFERGELTNPETTSNSTRAYGYKVIGSNLDLLPRPPANHTALVWYATTVTQLAADAATFDTVERLDDYVIWYAAREIANERQNWQRYDRLTAAMGMLEGDIRVLARSIDLTAGPRVTNLQYANTFRDRYGRRWRR